MSDFNCAEVVWDVDTALKYAEDPDCVTRKSERVLALEVRRLRKKLIDEKERTWDWQRQSNHWREKYEALVPIPSEATLPKYRMERDEWMSPPKGDNWRIVEIETANRVAKISSARPPYIALVWGEELSKKVLAALNAEKNA